MAIYTAREGPFGTVNTWAALSTLGSSGTVNSIVVPAGMNSIQEIWGAFCEPVPNDTSGAVICVKLSGAGLVYGEQRFILGGMGREETGNSGYSSGITPTKLQVQIAVKPGAEIWIYGAQYGTDSGTPEAAVGMVFSEQSAPERYNFTRMAACAALDTDVILGADVDVATAGPIQLPGTCRHIYSITTATHGICLVGATGGTSFVRLRGALKNGELVMTAGAMGCLSTTTGVSGGYMKAVQVPTSVEVVGGGQITCYGCQSGVDWGTPYVAVCLEVGP